LTFEPTRRKPASEPDRGLYSGETLHGHLRAALGPAPMELKVTVRLRDSEHVGRTEVVKVREDGVKGLTDDVPTAMLPTLWKHWEAMGWTVVDERTALGRQ